VKRTCFTHFVFCAALVTGGFAHVSTASAELKTQTVDYKQGDTALEGYLAYDSAVTGKRPAVLVLHRFDGMSDFTRRQTEAIAKLGYVAFAADIYGKDVRPKSMPEFVEQSRLYNKDRALMKARAQAGFDALRRQSMVDPARLAMVGYCFGGTVVVELAQTGAPVLGSVAIHGSFRGHAPEGAKNIKGRFLILHGAEDAVAPLEEVNKLIGDLRAAKIDWQMELYSGAEHGFSTPQNKAEERANALSIVSMTRFLADVLGN
jgi:dienelactone hydrolase